MIYDYIDNVLKIIAYIDIFSILILFVALLGATVWALIKKRWKWVKIILKYWTISWLVFVIIVVIKLITAFFYLNL